MYVDRSTVNINSKILILQENVVPACDFVRKSMIFAFCYATCIPWLGANTIPQCLLSACKSNTGKVRSSFQKFVCKIRHDTEVHTRCLGITWVHFTERLKARTQISPSFARRAIKNEELTERSGLTSRRALFCFLLIFLFLLFSRSERLARMYMIQTLVHFEDIGDAREFFPKDFARDKYWNYTVLQQTELYSQ